MKRYLLLSYSIFVYVLALLSILYSVGFLGNLVVVRTIDAAALVPMGPALFVNIGLLFLFSVQHSGLTHRRVSKCHQRSSYVLACSIALIIVMALWQPMGGIIWAVQNQMWSRTIYVVYFAGWALMFYATFLIDHFELFGLRQAWTAFRRNYCWGPELKTSGLYRYVRHPIYLGWLLVVWAAPTMTVTHLVFAAGMTIYMLVGIHLEERDLATELAEYEQYKRKVPMLLPSWRKRLYLRPDR